MRGLAGHRPSADTGREAWSLSRIVVLCAVLGGLFLMHGLSIQDCHDPAPAAWSAQVPAPGEHGAVTSGPTPTVQRAPGSVDVHRPETGLGASCVSVPPSRQSGALVAMLLVCGVLAAGVVRSAGVPARNRRRRAPPRPGRVLLTALCVSRT